MRSVRFAGAYDGDIVVTRNKKGWEVGKGLIFGLMDFAIVSPILKVVFPETTLVHQKEFVGEIGRSIFYGIIWILYMLKSKRVRNTFVN